MPSLATLDWSSRARAHTPVPTWRPPSPAPARPDGDGTEGLSAEQQALDTAAALEAGMGASEVATLSAYGIRPSELDPEAARRMAVGLARLQALLACEGGNVTACALVGQGLVGHETAETVAGDTSEALVVEDADFTLRLTTRIGADGQTERVLFYQDVDGGFLSGVSTEPLEPRSESPDSEPAPTSEEGLRSFLEGAVLGDLADNDSWSAVAGQTLVGLVPGLGQVADARDTAAAVADVVQGEDGAWERLAGAAVGWVPGVGDALKGGLRIGRKLGPEVVEEGAERLIREGVEEGAEREGMEASARAVDGASAPDPWDRVPRRLQDQMALEAARNGAGKRIIKDLGDPRYQGMEKWEYKVKSADGRDSVIHYVYDPATGERMDFKFKKQSDDFQFPPGM